MARNKKVAFIAKTNLNTDGRILNELKILENEYPGLNIDFILFADKPLNVLIPNISIREIKTNFRHNKFLRIFTIFEFSIKCFKELWRLNPDILHVQDIAVVFPVYLYILFKTKKPIIIYDDHEMPYEKEGLINDILNRIEIKLIKKADHVLFANEERLDIIKSKLNLKNSCSYFLNLPYFESEGNNSCSIDFENSELISKLTMLKQEGFNFIMHQGFIIKERGYERLAGFSRKLPSNFKILLLGGNVKDYEAFILRFNLNRESFYFVGSVNYSILPLFWDICIASIVMYLPTYINNRLCAPNRFYLSIKKGLPVLVNNDNPVLSNFIKKYNCGMFIDDVNENNFLEKLNFVKDLKFSFSFDQIKNKQIDDFVQVYNDVLYT